MMKMMHIWSRRGSAYFSLFSSSRSGNNLINKRTFALDLWMALAHVQPQLHAAACRILPPPGESFEIVNPCTDFGFKRAFGNPNVLKDFLNHILDYKDGEAIVALSYIDKEFPSLHPLGRDFRVDFVCQTQSNKYSAMPFIRNRLFTPS